MSKASSSYELTLSARPPEQTLTTWLYAELRRAILEGRLATGARLPASRDFAIQHGLSRGTVVSVFERLQAEGYVSSRVGSGTSVNRLATVNEARTQHRIPPAYIRRAAAAYVRPKPWTNLVVSEGLRPFGMRDAAVDKFPAKLWGSSWQAEKEAAVRGVEVIALDRYTLNRPDPKGLLLGFGAFDESAIRKGLLQLAAVLESRNPKQPRTRRASLRPL